MSALTQSTRSCWSLACRKNFLIPALMTNRRQRAAGTVRTRYPSNRKTLTDTASHIPLEAKGNGDLRLCGLRTAHHAALGPTHGPPSDPSPGSAVSLKRCSASERMRTADGGNSALLGVQTGRLGQVSPQQRNQGGVKVRRRFRRANARLRRSTPKQHRDGSYLYNSLRSCPQGERG